MKITSPILKHLSLQISNGNPWWGLVVANEYVPASSRLHHALASQFIRRIGSTSGDLKRLADKLIEGARFEQLAPHLQLEVGKRRFSPLREADPQPRIARTFPSPTARRPPLRHRNSARPKHLTTPIRDEQGNRSLMFMNPKASSLAPYATLRGVRMS
jgi:hypothetical protein